VPVGVRRQRPVHPRVLNNALTSDGEVDAMLHAIEVVREIASQSPLRGLLGE
jgi:hypothetical protein